MRTEPYPREPYLAHPGRDPNHIYGGYVRKIRNPFGEIVKLLPHNPGRWKAHCGQREQARRLARNA